MSLSAWRIVAAISLFTFLPLRSEAVDVFAREASQLSCNRELKLAIERDVQRRTWFPKTVFEQSGAHEAISHRDTLTHRAYTVWSETGGTALVVSNLETNREIVTTWRSTDLCRARTYTRVRQQPTLVKQGGFADQDLDSLLKKNKTGIIYVWSPYMPLSVAAIKEITGASKAAGLPLTVLMDPNAKSSDSQAWVEKKSVASADLRPSTSNELLARGQGLHFPTAFFYESGYLSNRIYLGFKEERRYRNWIASERSAVAQELKR